MNPEVKAADSAAAAAAEDVDPSTLPNKIDPKAVAAKVAAGLTKDQAVEVLQSQALNDARIAKEEKKPKK